MQRTPPRGTGVPRPVARGAAWAAPFVLALAAVAPPAAAQAGPTLTDRVDAVFSEWDRPDSPGCALGVVRDGALIYTRGYGSANLDYGVPLDRHTVFYLASVSKQFTAAAVAHAAQRGLLSLDDDVRKWIPELPDYGDTITLQHLIHHTSGLRDYLGLMQLAGMRYADVHPAQEILELIARQRELNFRPGDDYLYSNTGYFLLSVILERATGQTLHEYASENFFRPLGMTNTHFHDDAGHVQKNRAYSYAPDDEEGFRISFLANFAQVGSGGLYSTVEDLYRWDQNFYDARVGGRALIDRLHDRFVLNSGDTLDYAFGLTIGEHRGLRTVAHGGSMMGFKTALVRFPDERFSVICLCNLGSIDPTGLAYRVADIYLADRLAPSVADAVDGGGRERGDAAGEKARPALDAAMLAAFAGSYYSDELGATYDLAVRDGALMLRAPLGEERRLAPSGEDVFTAGPLELDFERDAGRVTGFRLMAGRVRNLAFTRR